MAKNQYSTQSEAAREVCERIGFDFSICFVSAMRKGEKIYVRGTCGKLDEFALLRKRCTEQGFIYKSAKR
jgi:hypothetical protein